MGWWQRSLVRGLLLVGVLVAHHFVGDRWWITTFLFIALFIPLPRPSAIRIPALWEETGPCDVVLHDVGDEELRVRRALWDFRGGDYSAICRITEQAPAVVGHHVDAYSAHLFAGALNELGARAEIVQPGKPLPS